MPSRACCTIIRCRQSRYYRADHHSESSELAEGMILARAVFGPADRRGADPGVSRVDGESDGCAAIRLALYLQPACLVEHERQWGSGSWSCSLLHDRDRGSQ